METQHSTAQFNAIINENDMLYRKAAALFGLPDCAFWILYALREGAAAPMTQSMLCETLYLPKQTINSALKKLEASGILCLSPAGGRRGKRVTLTEKGLALARETVDRVIAAEEAAFSALSPAQRTAFFAAFRQYTNAMKREMEALASAPRNAPAALK